MKTIMYQLKDPMEDDFGIDIRFKKEKDDKDFDLRMWRLIHDKDSQNFILWTISNLSKGNVIYSELLNIKELKNIENRITIQNKLRKRSKKIITIASMLIGMFMIISPLWNQPDVPNMWIIIFGYIIVILSAVAHSLIDFDNKEK